MSGGAEDLVGLLLRKLSLQDVEGAATQTLFETLDAETDASVYALETAPTQAAFAAAQQQYSQVFSTFGEDGIRLDHEMNREANVFGMVDHLLGGGAGATQDDVLAFTTQLSTAGNDFGALGVDLKSLGTIASQDDLMGVCTNLAVDCASLTSDFGALSGDAAAMQADLAAMGQQAHMGGVAAAIAPLAGEYAAISTDFANMFTLYTGGTTDANGVAIDFGGVFKSLDADLITLDNTMHGLAQPLAQVIERALGGGGHRCG